MALKVTQHSDTDLWDLCRKITEFDKVIDLIMQGRTNSENLNKIIEIKFAKTATQNEKFISLTQQFSEMLTKLYLIDLGIVCISDMPFLSY